MEHRKNTKLSIIIPIYNREHVLSHCLESVRNISFQDYEVLMIDDGSTDGSSLLCKTFEQQDKRFHYFYKENGGVSSARNLGIKKAQGIWITFIDSDDIVLREHFSILSNSKIDSRDLVSTGTFPIQDYVDFTPPPKFTNINYNQRQSKYCESLFPKSTSI